jgi:hypothetical protein
MGDDEAIVCALPRYQVRAGGRITRGFASVFGRLVSHKIMRGQF